MENEIWKDIPNYEGLYQASNFGRVKGLPKKWFTYSDRLVGRKAILPNPCYKKCGLIKR